jgi:hypothetical protein
MDNPFLKLIESARVTSPDELRAAYHSLVMKTHPDAVGSPRLLSRFLKLGEQYEEAKGILGGRAAGGNPAAVPEPINHRVEFYRALGTIESLEAPYAFHPEDNAEAIRRARDSALRSLASWNPSIVELYRRADGEHHALKLEKPRGPYMRHALALNLRPVFHNVSTFHLTGRDVYARQSRQNKDGILHQLRTSGRGDLCRFLEFLYADMENGPAVLG